MKEAFFMTAIFTLSGIQLFFGVKQGEAASAIAGITHRNDGIHLNEEKVPHSLFDHTTVDPDSISNNTKCHPLNAGGSLKV